MRRTKEVHRGARTFRWLEDAGRDIRYACRTLLRAPGFTALAVATLALGIGSVTIIYSVIHDVLVDPLPYRDADRFVNVAVVELDSGRRRNLSAREFLDVESQSDVFEAVFGARADSAVLTTANDASLLRIVRVTPNFFDVMGLPPLLGRTLEARDSEPHAPPVAVLRHRAWVTYFGADRDVVGRVIHLDGAPRTVVGVMSARFTWHAADAWLPGPVRPHATGSDAAPRSFQARLREGVSLEDAEAQLSVIARRLAFADPAAYPKPFRLDVVSVIDQVVGDFRGVLYAALGAVVLLLLIACCNVANMLLAKASARAREMTIRAALGAGRSRIVRQVLGESLLLGLIGAAGGALLAYVGIGALVPFLPQGPLPGEVEFGLDRAALLFSVGVAGAAALLFGIAPAVHSARRDLNEAMKSGGKGLIAAPGPLRNTLVIAGIALSLVLVLSAGLLTRSFLTLINVDLGFDPRPILVRHVTFPVGGPQTPADRHALYTDALRRIAAIPGVVAAAASFGVPPFGAGSASPVQLPGTPVDPQRTAQVHFCTADFFRTLNLRFRRGSPFVDPPPAGPVRQVVVSQAFVRAYFDNLDPIGRQITIMLPASGGGPSTPAAVEVVGVVDDIRNRGLREPAAPQVYVPAPHLVSNPSILIRTAVEPGAIAGDIRAAIRMSRRDTVVREPGTVEDILGTAVYAQPRFSLIVIGLFAVAGTLLVGIGVFSVMAYNVAQQTREIGLRMALGATRAQVMTMVLRSGGRLFLIGVALGLVGSFAAGRALERQLWGVSPYDPQIAAMAVGLVGLVAVLACYLPARRAIRVDPMVALRLD